MMSLTTTLWKMLVAKQGQGHWGAWSAGKCSENDAGPAL